LKKFFIHIGLLISIFLIVLEIVLRVTHIAPEFPARMLDDQFGVYKFQPNQSGIFTDGRLGEWKSSWCINNEGWNSELHYKQGERITGLIGDSYIQTIYFDPENHPYNLFNRAVPSRKFYSFGIQGASFSQYLNILRYASETYQMDSVLIFLDNNDLDESIASMTRMPRNMQLQIVDDSIIEIPAKYHEKVYRNFFKNIAIFRYGLMNFSFRINMGSAKIRNKNPKIKNNINDLKKKAVQYIVAEMQKCKVKHITFVLDGQRSDIYENNQKSNSKFWTYFKGIEQNDGLLIVDLHTFFKKDYAQNGLKFEVSEENNHWNLATNKKIVEHLVIKAEL